LTGERMTWSLWIISSVALFIVEILTPGAFFFACLGVGALFAGIAQALELPYGLPYMVFVVVSVVSIYTVRPIAKRFFKQNDKRSNVDALMGQKAWVTEAISPTHLGMVKIEGELWRAEAGETIEPGNWVEVVAVKGTRLEVKISDK
ncbi:MAG: NfeD family protein, partial [Endomicrobiales bacterium]